MQLLAINPEDAHWAAVRDVARRRGLTSSKRIGLKAADGYLHAPRERNSAEIEKSIEESRNQVGRKKHGSGEEWRWRGVLDQTI